MIHPTYSLLITGATGFIGGALSSRLIQTERWPQFLFLIRSNNQEEGLSRLQHVLLAHGVSEKLSKSIKPDQILCGGLTDVDDWKDDPRLSSITDVVNSAAVASFGNHPSIWPTNVDGVMRLVDLLVERCHIRRFIHIGTAMACGAEAPSPVPEGYDDGPETQHFLEYTASKYEIEKRIRETYPDFPLVVVRPSIVVGHTQLGCQASGSIFWVFRIARALRCFPCDLDQKIDVIPVDYCAQALHALLDKPVLKFNSYHISAGERGSCSFGDIDAAIAQGLGEEPMYDYQTKSVDEIALMRHQFRELLGPCNNRIVLRAIRAYGNFSALGLLFDNKRLIEEGIGMPTPLTKYAGLCAQTSKNTLIADQMKFDYK